MTKRVTVYSYSVRDAIGETVEQPAFKRTRDGIAFLKDRRGVQADIIEDTAEEVDESALDDMGRYFPNPTNDAPALS